MDQPTAKVCARCGDLKSASEFHRSQTSPDGLRRECRVCRSASRRKAPKPWAMVPTPPPGFRVCHRCVAVLKETEFFASRPTYCKTCVEDLGAQWRETNPEAVKASKSRTNSKHAVAYAEYRRRYHAANKERDNERSRAYHDAHREKRVAAAIAWMKAHPERTAEINRRKRAKRAGAERGPVDLEALWTGYCGLCRAAIDGDLRHPDPLSKSIDHVVPLARGGSHTQDNLQWAHLICNTRKGARTDAETA